MLPVAVMVVAATVPPDKLVAVVAVAALPDMSIPQVPEAQVPVNVGA